MGLCNPTTHLVMQLTPVNPTLSQRSNLIQPIKRALTVHLIHLSVSIFKEKTWASPVVCKNPPISRVVKNVPTQGVQNKYPYLITRSMYKLDENFNKVGIKRKNKLNESVL